MTMTIKLTMVLYKAVHSILRLHIVNIVWQLHCQPGACIVSYSLVSVVAGVVYSKYCIVGINLKYGLGKR